MIDNVVASDQWSQLIFYPEWNTLELKYLPSTRDATDGDVRNTMERLCAEAENRKPSALILDATEYHHPWGKGLEEWSNENIIPGLNKADVTKIAYIAGPGYPGPTWRRARSPHPTGRQISRPAGFPPRKGPTRGSPGRSDEHDQAARLTCARDRDQIDGTGIPRIGLQRRCDLPGGCGLDQPGVRVLLADDQMANRMNACMTICVHLVPVDTTGPSRSGPYRQP